MSEADTQGESAEDGDAGPSSGEVRLYWAEEPNRGESREVIDGVVRVSIRDQARSRTPGTLVLHLEDGLAAFDRERLRGFQAYGGVEVPAYQEADSGSSSGDRVGVEK